MRVSFLLLIVSLTVFAPLTGVTQEKQADQLELNQVNNLGRKFINAVKTENDSEIVKIADTIFEKKYDKHLSTSFVGYFLIHSSYAYWRSDDEVKALRSAQILTTLDNSDERDKYYNSVGLRLSFFLNRILKNQQATYDSLKSLLVLSQNQDFSDYAETLQIEQQQIQYFLRDLSSETYNELHPLKVKTYESIFDHGYEPQDPFRSLDFWRLDYAKHLIAIGNEKEAKKLILAIESPPTLLKIYIDRSFEKFWTMNNLKSMEKIESAYQKHANRLEKLTEKHSKNLQGLVWYIQALVDIGQIEKAKKLANSALVKSTDFDGFEDREESLNWLLNELATLSYLEGDADSGNTYMERAAARAEVGGSNISQVINYTEKLLAQGKYDEAIQYQTKFVQPEKASDYGKMWIWFNEACIFHLLNDFEKSKSAMLKLETNPKLNDAAYTSALICKNDINGAAQSYIRRLNDIESRSQALYALQNFIPNPSELPFEKLMRDRQLKIASDPQLLETVKKYGRIESWPVTNTYWVSY